MTSAKSSKGQTGKAWEFELTRRVEFGDTDMAGIMHFSNYFRFMESAETAFLRSLGLSVLLSRHGLEVCLPRVHAECDYSDPLHFEDEVLIHLLVERMGRCSLTYGFRFYVGNGAGCKQVACGRLVLATAARRANGKLKAVPLPKVLAERIQQAPAQMLAQRAPAAGRRRAAIGPISGNGAGFEGSPEPAVEGEWPRKIEGRPK